MYCFCAGMSVHMSFLSMRIMVTASPFSNSIRSLPGAEYTLPDIPFSSVPMTRSAEYSTVGWAKPAASADPDDITIAAIQRHRMAIPFPVRFPMSLSPPGQVFGGRTFRSKFGLSYHARAAHRPRSPLVEKHAIVS